MRRAVCGWWRCLRLSTVGLGSTVVGDLPKKKSKKLRLSLDDFAPDCGKQRSATAKSRRSQSAMPRSALEQAQLKAQGLRLGARRTFNNWLPSRRATRKLADQDWNW
jgi:hypothetical protein